MGFIIFFAVILGIAVIYALFVEFWYIMIPLIVIFIFIAILWYVNDKKEKEYRFKKEKERERDEKIREENEFEKLKNKYKGLDFIVDITNKASNKTSLKLDEMINRTRSNKDVLNLEYKLEINILYYESDYSSETRYYGIRCGEDSYNFNSDFHVPDLYNYREAKALKGAVKEIMYEKLEHYKEDNVRIIESKDGTGFIFYVSNRGYHEKNDWFDN